MSTISLALMLIIVTASASQNGQPGSEDNQVKQLVCDAASKKLAESNTSAVALRMTIDTAGRVESFTTESPKGLRLEKMKEVSAAIKAVHFKPATKDGHPVMVQIRVEFDCANQPSKNN